MSKTGTARRWKTAAFLVCTTSTTLTGCSTGGMSLASLNPFNRNAPTVATTPSPGAETTGKLAAMRQTASGQVSSMGTATKSAFSKTKNGITGIFGSKPKLDENGNPIASDDPTRLDTPASVGPDVFVAQGQLWETTGDFQKAMQSYTRALESEPRNAAALASVARLNFRQENYPAATDAFRKAIAETPNDAGLLNDYGLAQAKTGDSAGATASMEKALSIAPGTSRFANNLANAKYDAGDSAGALAVLMQHNKPAVAHFNMAFLHYKAGRMAEAKTHLSEVVKYEPQSAGDSSVAKAVARSKEMLATIEAPASRIAQAAPAAMNAANQFVGAFTQPPAAAQVKPTTAPAIPASFTQPPATVTPPAMQAPAPWLGGSTPPGTATRPVMPAGTAPPATAPAATTPGQVSLPPGFFNQ